MTARKTLAFALVALCALAMAGCGRARPDHKVTEQGAAYMAENAKKPGVQTTKSGVQYRILKSGPSDGLKPGPADVVTVNYEGKLVDGTVFDSSYAKGQPAQFEVGGLIPGWTEILQLMRPGDEWEIVVPPLQGYGDDAAGPIPAGSTLIFRMELISVKPAVNG